MALEPVGYTAVSTTREAVNRMLAAIGQKAVASVDIGDSNPDVEQALRTLLEVSREVQSIGWHFNTYRKFPIQPNGDGEIILPVNTLKVDNLRCWPHKDLVQRYEEDGTSKLYDNEEHTFDIGVAVKVDYVALFPFEQIPQSARWYITVLATRRFATDELNSDNAYRFTKQDEDRALARFESDDAANSDRNLKRVNPHVRRMRRR